jgi:N-acetylglucosamine-6-phosphate deacetylase
MRTWIINGLVVNPGMESQHAQILVEEDRITDLPAGDAQAAPGDQTIDASGMIVIPGLIDIHIHGAKNFDTMDATAEALQNMALFNVRCGVTSFLPTTVAASPEDTIKAIEAVRGIKPSKDGAQILGIDLEGPYLDEQYCGAQPSHHFRLPEPKEYNRWFESGVVRLITIAPEKTGALEMIKKGIDSGIRFAVGHSQANLEQMQAAIDAGLDQATHLFNGMPGLHHRNPGVVGAVLGDDRVRAQLIVDGVHIHPIVVKITAQIKGFQGIILISDATRAVGMGDGEYLLGDEKIFVKNGVARTSQGGLGGSTLTMDTALRNLIAFTGMSLSKALATATINPARALGLDGRKGMLVKGADADIVLLDADHQVRLTMVQGNTVFSDM